MNLLNLYITLVLDTSYFEQLEHIGGFCSMKRLKQIEESKNLIAEAFLRLLQKESMEMITISQIATEATVGRNTFYNHFQKKEDILLYLFDKLFNKAKEAFKHTINPSLKEFLLWRFKLMKSSPLLDVLSREEDIRLILNKFRDSHTNFFNIGLGNDEFKKAFILGGIDAITLKWIDSGMDEPPEVMVKKVLSIIGS